mmetsp:Transcript_52386/g.125135  ORF Transcript_52386/g.125135 Transcript_52386/m.125135 type:complete len:425 (+) Transcript_52386:251-1525(+)
MTSPAQTSEASPSLSQYGLPDGAQTQESPPKTTHVQWRVEDYEGLAAAHAKFVQMATAAAQSHQRGDELFAEAADLLSESCAAVYLGAFSPPQRMQELPCAKNACSPVEVRGRTTKVASGTAQCFAKAAKPLPQLRGAVSKKASAPRCKSREERIFQELHRLLIEMSPDLRRKTIAEKFSQAQRRKLEAWMVSQRDAAPAQCKESHAKVGAAISQRTLCRVRSTCGRALYRPTLHVAAGLYVSSTKRMELDEAIVALGVMIAIRSLSLIGHGNLQDRVAFAEQASVGMKSTSTRLSYRCRVGIAAKSELATPAQQSIALALQDWCALQVFLASRKPLQRVAEDEVEAWHCMQLAASTNSSVQQFEQWHAQVCALQAGRAKSQNEKKRPQQQDSLERKGGSGSRNSLESRLNHWLKKLQLCSSPP